MNSKLNILIADDEPLARVRIREMLKNEDRAGLISEAANGDEAYQKTLELRPDIIFLDIQMPGCDGFQFLRNLKESHPDRMPIIIFVTAFDEYAIKAFEFYATDYLLKPFDRSRFEASFNLACERILSAKKGQYEQRMFELLENVKAQNTYLEWVSVKKNEKISLVKIDEIQWIEAQGNYVSLKLSNSNQLLREKMDAIAAKLDPQKFFRIHRSTIININFVQEIQIWGRSEQKFVMKDGKKFNISRTYRGNFDEFFRKKVL